MARLLERLRAKGGSPGVICADNGPEFTGKALDRRAQAAGVKLEFIRPGKPTDNGHVESFNRRFREECLDAQMFSTLEGARKTIEAWRRDYNTARLHSSLGGLSPEEYRTAWSRENQSGQRPNFRLVYSVAGVRSGHQC